MFQTRARRVIMLKRYKGNREPMGLEDIKLERYDDLVKLPWFEKREDGRMMIKPGSGAPRVLDTHTHLGWSYLGGAVIDYEKFHEKTLQYYNYDNAPVTFERDGHPNTSELNAMTFDIALIVLRCPPQAKTQTAANILEEMDRFGYAASVILPIEIPLRSRHAYQCVTTCAKHERLISFAAVHPLTKYKKLRLDWQVSQGAIGLKYHPEFQFCPPDAKGAVELFGMCAERGLPVMGHSGATGREPKWMQKLAEPERFIPALEAHPKLQLIFGHTGIIHNDRVIAIAKRFPDQVWLETSGQGVQNIRHILDSYDKQRVLYGSDWSFYPLGVPMARSLVALESYPAEVAEDYFHANAARLLGFDPKETAKGNLVRVSK